MKKIKPVHCTETQVYSTTADFLEVLKSETTNVPEVNTPYPGGCSDKAPVDDLGGQSDGLEYLCSLVGLHGGDAHLGHHLGDSPVHCGGVVLVSLILTWIDQVCSITHIYPVVN